MRRAFSINRAQASFLFFLRHQSIKLTLSEFLSQWHKLAELLHYKHTTQHTKSTMMMEWERSTSGNGIDNNLADNGGERIQRRRRNLPKRTSPSVSEAERSMMQMLLPHDVLLVGRPAMKALAPGQSEYLQLLKQLHANTFQQTEAVHTLLSTVWSQGGRFLQHDSLKGTISILSNEQAERLIRQDLKRKSSSTKKSIRKTATKKRNGPKSSSKSNTSPKSAAMKAKHTKKNKRKQRRVKPMKLDAPTILPKHNHSTNTKLFGQASNGVLFGDV